MAAYPYRNETQPYTKNLLLDGVVDIGPEEQRERLTTALHHCIQRIVRDEATQSVISDDWCEWTWDDISCWPRTPPGTLAVQPCPDYINNFNVTGNATRQCTENGTWYFHPTYNHTWTNYSQCLPDSRENLIQQHMWRIELIYSVGYGLSLASLLIAIGIMLFFKKLHCSRNTIHINLFVSFILRAVLSFLQNTLLIDGLGLPSDVHVDENNVVEFKEGGMHWQCKLLLTVFNYAMGANYMWIFVEGLYLNMIIFVAVFSDKSGIIWYIILGWGGPLLFIIPWTMVRTFLEDTLCWNTHPTPAYFWIIKGPITALIIVNFVFFLNIIRVLFTKLEASNTAESRKYRYRKLAKSTLVLIPLFGAHYILLLGLPNNVEPQTELVKLYFEMFFNSFQGFMVAFLFCFLNGEVQSEIKKKWYRYQLRKSRGTIRHSRSTWSTVSTYMTRARHSLYSIHSTVDKPESIPMANGTHSNGNPFSKLPSSNTLSVHTGLNHTYIHCDITSASDNEH